MSLQALRILVNKQSIGDTNQQADPVFRWRSYQRSRHQYTTLQRYIPSGLVFWNCNSFVSPITNDMHLDNDDIIDDDEWYQTRVCWATLWSFTKCILTSTKSWDNTNGFFIACNSWFYYISRLFLALVTDFIALVCPPTQLIEKINIYESTI